MLAVFYCAMEDPLLCCSVRQIFCSLKLWAQDWAGKPLAELPAGGDKWCLKNIPGYSLAPELKGKLSDRQEVAHYRK